MSADERRLAALQAGIAEASARLAALEAKASSAPADESAHFPEAVQWLRFGQQQGAAAAASTTTATAAEQRRTPSPTAGLSPAGRKRAMIERFSALSHELGSGGGARSVAAPLAQAATPVSRAAPPAGHTAFSWGGVRSAPPPGHTAFSWSADAAKVAAMPEPEPEPGPEPEPTEAPAKLQVEVEVDAEVEDDLSSPLPPDLETPRQAAVLPPTPPQHLTEPEPGPGAEPEPKQLKLYIPAIPNYNVIGLLIGPRGQTQRLLEKVPLLT